MTDKHVPYYLRISAAIGLNRMLRPTACQHLKCLLIVLLADPAVLDQRMVYIP